MCLIIAKPKGSSFPSRKKLKTWADTYKDGVGIAFPYRGQIRIIKGAMSAKEVIRLAHSVKKIISKEGQTPEEVDMLIQYRQAFTGSVCPKFCHPFPVSSEQADLDSLDVLTSCALAHNGVIWDYNPTTKQYITENKMGDINDAQEFIKDYLVGFGDSLWNPYVQKLIRAHTDSKFALLSNKGITYIGEFIEDEGLWYSNLGYKGIKTTMAIPYYDDRQYWRQPWEETLYQPRAVEEEKNGILCDFCQSYIGAYYHEEDTLLCLSCFRQLIGRAPTLDEAVY